jgi:hypothetical protein
VLLGPGFNPDARVLLHLPGAARLVVLEFLLPHPIIALGLLQFLLPVGRDAGPDEFLRLLDLLHYLVLRLLALQLGIPGCARLPPGKAGER